MVSYRERYVKNHAADLITDALEEAVGRNTLTREEVEQLYQKLAELLDNTDFLPRKPESRLMNLFRSALKPVWNPKSGIQP